MFKRFLPAMAAAILAAVCLVNSSTAQVPPTVLQTATSQDGLLTIVLSSSNPTDAVNVNNTYTWTVTNNGSVPLTGVILGSHWGDFCVGSNPAPGFNAPGRCPIAPPQGPTLISSAPGCGGQSPAEFGADIASFGIWCTPSTGVTLGPHATISGSVTLRPHNGGPAYYTVYSAHNPISGPPSATGNQLDPFINYHGMVAPAATDVQITGAANTGSPLVGSTFTYTFQVHDAGPWGTFGGLIFTDTLPASLTFVSSTTSTAVIDTATGQTVQITLPNRCSAVGQTVVCPLQDLTNGGVAGQATIVLTVEVAGPAQLISNTATVHTAAPQDDTNLTNNSVTVNVTSK